jgi:hypothetical protein
VSEALERGDAIAAGCFVIEVSVVELKQLFNAMDPSPFDYRDLDPAAAEFIVGWAQEAPRDARLALRVHLGRAPGPENEADILRGAIHGYFANRAIHARRRLRELMRRGRTSLVIGLGALALFVLIADLVGNWLEGRPFAIVARESLVIGGWVAMWRPLEVFLYDWWPIRAEARLFDRLAEMPLQIRYTAVGAADAWRADWPASAVRTDRALP